MIVSKQSLINAAAQRILAAEKMDHPESMERALEATGGMLYGNVAEINEADQVEILARIRDAVNEEIGGDVAQSREDDARSSRLMAPFANGFVDASQTMALADIDHDALRTSVADMLAACSAAQTAGKNRGPHRPA